MVNVRENRARVELEPLGPADPRTARAGWSTRCGSTPPPTSRTTPTCWPTDLPRELEALVPTSIAGRLAATVRWRVEASLVAPGRMRVEAVT